MPNSLLCAALLAMAGAACGNATTHPRAAKQGTDPTDGIAPWVLQTAALGNGCESRVPNGKPVQVVADEMPVIPRPVGASRELEAGSLIPGCQNLASVAAVCDCLETTSADVGEHVTCEVEQSGGTHGQVVSLEEIVEEDSDLIPGHQLILVARIGASWSALSLLAVAFDNDRNETPDMSHYAGVVDYQERVTESGIVLWAQTVHEQNETSMGVWDVSGNSELTICKVPNSASAAPECKARVPLANWMFAFDVGDVANDAHRCTVQTENTLTATLESSGNLTLAVSAGADEARIAGVYRAWK